MKIILYLTSLLLLACAPVGVARGAAGPTYRECLTALLVDARDTAMLIEDKTTAMEAQIPDASEELRADVAGLKKDARDLRVSVEAALSTSPPPAVAALETALEDSSMAVSWLELTVGSLALDLANTAYSKAFKAVEEMAAALKDLRQSVPADAPTKICKHGGSP